MFKKVKGIAIILIVIGLLGLGYKMFCRQALVKPCTITQNYIDLPQDKECNEYKKEDRSGIGPDTTKLVFQIKDMKIEDILPQATVEVNENVTFDIKLLEFFDDEKIHEFKGPYKEKYILKNNISGIYLIQIGNNVYGVIQKQM